MLRIDARRPRRDAGFALVEVMIAAGLLVTLAVGISQTIAVAVRVSYAARVRTVSTILAAQKMEQLLSLEWGHASAGSPPIRLAVSDTSSDLSSDPATDSGPGLQPSPPGVLESNVPFYFDYLDAAGVWVGRGPIASPRAVYMRRWAVQPLQTDPENVLLLQVLVSTAAGDQVRLVTVKARRP
jgi:type II secretory pathway pseudopilin PulG